LVEMHRELSAVTARGAQVVAIGQGTADEAGRICAQMGVDFPCLGDPEKASYRAYGLRRAGWLEIILDPMREGSEAITKGYKARIRGSLMRHPDWYPLPGVTTVARAGIVCWLHQARHSGDIPSPATVIAALPTACGSL